MEKKKSYKKRERTNWFYDWCWSYLCISSINRKRYDVSCIEPDLGNKINPWSMQKKAIIEVPRTEIIHQYNKDIGAENLSSFLKESYQVKGVANKCWYFYIMSNCIHVAVGNICLYDYMLYTKHYQQKNISRKKLLELLNF